MTAASPEESLATCGFSISITENETEPGTQLLSTPQPHRLSGQYRHISIFVGSCPSAGPDPRVCCPWWQPSATRGRQALEIRLVPPRN